MHADYGSAQKMVDSERARLLSAMEYKLSHKKSDTDGSDHPSWKKRIYYVKNFDCFIYYYLIDYLIDLAYSNNQYVRQLIDCLEINNEVAFLLNEVINNEFNKEKFEQIKKDTLFNKLDWHRNLQGLTVDNKITYYEYLKSINN